VTTLPRQRRKQFLNVSLAAGTPVTFKSWWVQTNQYGGRNVQPLKNNNVKNICSKLTHFTIAKYADVALIENY
jgi:hypothetical protein